MEDTRGLMYPQVDELGIITNTLGFSHKYALEHFANVSQVECVVELGWNG